jgi:hypothetical protein
MERESTLLGVQVLVLAATILWGIPVLHASCSSSIEILATGKKLREAMLHQSVVRTFKRQK